MKFVIYSYPYNQNSGGKIVLHQLCHLLNELGYEAYIWDYRKPILDKKNILKSLKLFYKYFEKVIIKQIIKQKSFKRNDNFNTPLAKTKDLKDSIVIYPEVIDGNPLLSNKVVRWLLHKPGFHTGRVNFSENELVFGYGEPCSGSGIVISEKNTLIIQYIMTDIYFQSNFGKREGSCYMVRKGKGKKFVHDENSICVDNYSHHELAIMFNKVKTFYSYDPYTYYSVYASLSGCNSIVVPDEGVSKEEWYPNEIFRYGLSYGLNDLDYANNTKSLMKNIIKEKEKKNKDSVIKFAKKCEAHFLNSIKY